LALIEHDLFRGRIDRVQIAIDRLKMFEPEEWKGEASRGASPFFVYSLWMTLKMEGEGKL
jgi:hypothetical protein